MISHPENWRFFMIHRKTDFDAVSSATKAEDRQTMAAI